MNQNNKVVVLIAQLNTTQAQAQAKAFIQNFKAQFNQTIGINIQVNQTQVIQQINNSLSSVTNNAAAATQGIGKFFGAFVGAGAVIAGLSSIASGLKDVAIESVRVGAEYEKTQKAFSAFTGSAKLAKEELDALRDAVQNTAGVRLQGAEEGVLTLRAVGFEAEKARDLLIGVAKQAVFSPDPEGLKRVLFNLSQIRAQGKLSGDELRETLTAIPALARVFQKEFGTISSKAIAELGLSSDQFFDKLINGLKNANTATGGLSDSYGKLQDEFIIAGREISQEIIPLITQTLRELTGVLRENRDTWKEIGERAADYYFLVSENAPEKSATGGFLKGVSQILPFNFESSESLRQRRKETQTLRDLGLPDDYLKPVSFEEYVKQRTGLTLGQLTDYQRRLNQLQNTGIDNTEQTVDNLRKEFSTLGTDRESVVISKLLEKRKAENANINEQRQLAADLKAAQERERARQDDLAKIDAYFSRSQNIRESAAAIELANAGRNADKLFAITDKNFSAQISETRAFYQKKLALTKGDGPERIKLEIEAGNEIRELETRQAVERIQRNQEVERQRRADQAQFNDLSLREIRTFYTRRNAEIERGIASGRFSGTGFDTLIENERNQLEQVAVLTRESFAARLQDESLTAQQRLNIQKEYYLQINSLIDESADRERDIEKKRFDEQADKLRQNVQFTTEILRQRETVFSTLGSAVSPGLNFGEGIRGTSLFGLFEPQQTTEILLNINKVKAGTLAFFDVQSEFLTKQQTAQTEQLDKQIRLNQDLLKLETDRFIKNEEIYLSSLKVRRETQNAIAQNPNRSDEDTTTAKALVTELDKLIEATDKGINKLKSGEVLAGTPEAVRTKQNLAILQGQKAQLKLSQDLEKETLKQNSSVEKLRETYAAIGQGLKDNLIIQISELELLQSRNDAAADFRRVALTLQNENLLNLERERNAIQTITDLRKTELDAILAIDSAQIRLNEKMLISQNQIRANVLEFFAGTRTINEAIADGIIGTYEAIEKKANSVLDKLNEKTQGFLAFIIEPLKAIQSNQIQGLFTGLLDKVFPGAGEILKTETSNPIAKPIVSKLDASNNYLKQIASNTARTNVTQNVTITGGGLGAGNGQGNLTQTLTNSILGNLPPALANRADFFSNFKPSVNAGTRTGDNSNKFNFFGAGGFFGAKGFGFNSGTLQGVGSLAGLASGFIPGIGGSALGGIASGIGLTSSLSSLLGISALGGPLGLAIGGIVGGGLALFSSIFGKQKQRRADERTRNQLMLDSLKQLDEILNGVKNLQIPSDAAITQANQVRENYLDTSRSLKDSKTRRIALKDVSRLDAKIEQIKAEAAKAKNFEDKDKRILAEFATGGFVRVNGMMSGTYTGRDYIKAKIGDGEMVLNPMQQSRVIKKAGFDVFANSGIPNYSGNPQSAPVNMNTGGRVSVTDQQAGENVFYIQLFDVNGTIQAAIKSDNGRKNIVKIVDDAKGFGDFKNL